MHILFLTENFPPEVNAAATRVYERACYWLAWGHRVTVVTSAPNFPQGKLYSGYQNKWYQRELMSGIDVVRVKTYMAQNKGVVKRTLDFLSFMVSGFWAGIVQPAPDVVIATSPQFFSAVAGFMVGKVRRIPFVFELGDLWPASISALGTVKPGIPLQLLEKLELYLYRNSASVVALTRSFKLDLVHRGIAPDKIAVVINGVDLPRYEPRARCEELAAAWGVSGKFIVGYVGTHGLAHGLHNVLLAAELLQEQTEICFLFVGDGAERESLIETRKRMDLKNVRFIPPQPKELMPEVWSLCDVALIHLKNEDVFQTVIPSKMFEAMGMGLPILVVAPPGEASQIVQSQDAGIHVPAGQPEQLARAVETLYKDLQLRNALAQNSHASAHLFTRERQAHDLLLVLECAITGARTVPEKVQ